MLEKGFSLLEMLLALMLSSLILIGAISFFPTLQMQLLQTYHLYRLEQAMRSGISGLVKDIRRAGFIMADIRPTAVSPLVINSAKNCIIIRYDLDRSGIWEYYSGDAKNSDIFVYRFNKNNLEYRTGVPSCTGTGWEKIFDPAEVKVTQFSLEQSAYYLTIIMQTVMKKNSTLMKSLVQVVKHENV